MTLADALAAVQHLRTIWISLVGRFGGTGCRTINVDGVVAALRADREAPALILMDCIGGRYEDAKRVAEAIDDHRGTTVVQITCAAYSAAVVVACAADLLIGAPSSAIYIHRAGIDALTSDLTWYCASDLRNMAWHLDDIDAEINRVCAARSTKSAAWFRKMSDGDGCMMPVEEAFGIGMVDAVLAPADGAVQPIGQLRWAA